MVLLHNPRILGVPNAKHEEKITCGYLTLAFWGAQKRAEVLRNPGILPIPSAQRKWELATARLTSRGPERGQNCYVTTTFMGVPNARHGEQISIGSLPTTFSGAEKRGSIAT